MKVRPKEKLTTEPSAIGNHVQCARGHSCTYYGIYGMRLRWVWVAERIVHVYTIQYINSPPQQRSTSWNRVNGVQSTIFFRVLGKFAHETLKIRGRSPKCWYLLIKFYI